MYNLYLKIQTDLYPQHINKVFPKFLDCIDFRDSFPKDIIIDWSIAPLLLQDVIACRDSTRVKKTFDIIIRYDDDSTKRFYNVHTNNVGRLFFDDVNHKDVSEIKLIPKSCPMSVV